MCSAACGWDGACGTGRVVSWKQSTSEISHAFPGHIPGDGLMPDAVTRDSVKTHKGRRSVMRTHKNQLPRDASRQLQTVNPLTQKAVSDDVLPRTLHPSTPSVLMAAFLEQVKSIGFDYDILNTLYSTLQGPEKSSEEETVQLSQEEEERQIINISPLIWCTGYKAGVPCGEAVRRLELARKHIRAGWTGCAAASRLLQLSESRHAASSGPASGARIQQRPSLRGPDPAAAQPPGPGSSSGPASGARIQQRPSLRGPDPAAAQPPGPGSSSGHHSNQQCAH
ncbi:unnamed protein product [Arctogadus glacialis]